MVFFDRDSLDWIVEEYVVEAVVVVNIVETGADNPDFEQHWWRE